MKETKLNCLANNSFDRQKIFAIGNAGVQKVKLTKNEWHCSNASKLLALALLLFFPIFLSLLLASQIHPSFHVVHGST